MKKPTGAQSVSHGAAGRNRTLNAAITKRPLCLLSYDGMK